MWKLIDCSPNMRKLIDKHWVNLSQLPAGSWKVERRDNKVEWWKRPVYYLYIRAD